MVGLYELQRRSVEEQLSGLNRLERRLSVLEPRARLPAHARGVLAVATWNCPDESLMRDFGELAERDGESARWFVTLTDWFSSRDEFRQRLGYGGRALQVPMLLLRSGDGDTEFEGEGPAPRTEIDRRLGR